SLSRRLRARGPCAPPWIQDPRIHRGGGVHRERIRRASNAPLVPPAAVRPRLALEPAAPHVFLASRGDTASARERNSAHTARLRRTDHPSAATAARATGASCLPLAAVRAIFRQGACTCAAISPSPRSRAAFGRAARVSGWHIDRGPRRQRLGTCLRRRQYVQILRPSWRANRAWTRF